MCGPSNASANLLFDLLISDRIGCWRYISDNAEEQFLRERSVDVQEFVLPHAARRACSKKYSPSNSFHKHVNRACTEMLKSSDNVQVCTTAMAYRASQLSEMQYDTVLIDEAAQETEANTLLPVSVCQKSLIMVGDQKQLPATVKATVNRYLGHDISLFQRLSETHGSSVVVLLQQYRMHPKIAVYPSHAFYGGRLQSMTPNAPCVAGYAFPSAAPICFEQCTGLEFQENTSFVNHAQAERIRTIVYDFVGTGQVAAHQIGVLTPYSGQVKLIQNLLKEWHLEVGFVQSVDKAQGDERDIILYSSVCANRKGRVGFVSDARRLNVAMTRAKLALILLGDQKTLTLVDKEDVWTPFFVFFSEQNWIRFPRQVETRRVSSFGADAASSEVVQTTRSCYGSRMTLSQKDVESVFAKA